MNIKITGVSSVNKLEKYSAIVLLSQDREYLKYSFSRVASQIHERESEFANLRPAAYIFQPASSIG